jgi:hypothetical protein
MRDLEYDRFGPWVIEISENDPPPPIFVPYLTRTETPLLCIKIPRRIDRRDARPGMNLYDYLVTLYPDDLVILQRINEDVREHTFFYRDIQFLRYSEDLLKGTLQMGMRSAAFELRFNTVSNRIMKRLVAKMREWYCGEGRQEVEASGGKVEGLSYYFDGLLFKGSMQEPQFHLLAAQANTSVGSYEPGRWRRNFYTLTGKTLLESLHLSDGRELKIVTRGQDLKYKWQAIYAKEFNYLPLENISGVHWQEDEGHTAVSHLIIETPAGPLSFAFMSDNASIPVYDRFLKTAADSGPGVDARASHPTSN